MRITTRNKDLLISLTVIGMGIFFLLQTRMIESFGDDDVGPELVPTILSWLMIALGGLSAVFRLIFPDPNDKAQLRVPSSSLLWIGAITGLGLIYFFLFLATGYLLSTIVILGVILIAFGVRHPTRVLFISVLGGMAYYFIFIRVMKVYDPPGTLIDISTILKF